MVVISFIDIELVRTTLHETIDPKKNLGSVAKLKIM